MGYFKPHTSQVNMLLIPNITMTGRNLDFATGPAHLGNQQSCSQENSCQVYAVWNLREHL